MDDGGSHVDDTQSGLLFRFHRNLNYFPIFPLSQHHISLFCNIGVLAKWVFMALTQYADVVAVLI